MLVAGSITGVEVIPISMGMSRVSPVSAAGTVVTPFAGSMKLTFHNGVELRPFASNAYRLSCSVATYTTLWNPWPGMLTFAMYTGEANAYPSNGNEYSFPNVAAFTFACVSAISFKFWPVRIRSLWYVKTPALFDT